jgi:hypothetical protein
MHKEKEDNEARAARRGRHSKKTRVHSQDAPPLIYKFV